MTAAHDYSDLHELIDRLEPDQAEELREHALRLAKPSGRRFKILRAFSGPRMDLGAKAREVIRAAGDLKQIDIVAGDLIRIAALMRQYMGFPLGVADASVIAVADWLKASEVATLDQRHFRAVTPAHVTALNLLP